MDINVYGELKECLSKYFENSNLAKGHKPTIVEFEPAQPSYPIIKFTEVRNVPYEEYRGSRQTVANLGYRADIYAKTYGKSSKSSIARESAKYCNDFLTMCKSLRLVSWNVVENDGANGELYHIIMTYSVPYYEQRKKFL